MKNIFLLFIGIIGGLWLAWPGITSKRNWSCASEIILNSKEEKTDMRAVLAVSPNYLLKRKSNSPIDKLRIVGDACFR